MNAMEMVKGSPERIAFAWASIGHWALGIGHWACRLSCLAGVSEIWSEMGLGLREVALSPVGAIVLEVSP